MSTPDRANPLPPHEVEALLREAFAGRAAEVGLDALVRQHPALTDDAPIGWTDRAEAPASLARARERRRARWLAPVAAAAAVVAIGVAAGTGFFGRSTGEPTVPAGSATATGSVSISTSLASPSIPTSVAPSAGPIVAKEVGAEQIPWDRVGAGWTVAPLSTDEGQTVQVYLISPEGTRARVGSIDGRPSITAVSSDGRRALVISQNTGERQKVRELDLTTGQLRAVYTDDSAGYIAVGYADTAGSSILVATYTEAADGSTTTTLTRRSIDGTKLGDAGSYPGITIVLPSLDGSALLVGSGGRLAFHDANGARTATVINPSGMTWCQPVRWFDPSRALVNCRPAEGSRYLVQYTVARDGTTTQMTSSFGQPTGPAPDWITDLAGQWQAWAGPDGVQFSTYGTGCSTGQYFAGDHQLGQDPKPIGTLPGTDAPQAYVVSVIGTTAYAKVGCFEDPSSLALLDTATMTPTVVIGQPVTGGGVLGVRIIGASPWAIGVIAVP